MGPRCSSAETQVCHRSYIIAASVRWKTYIAIFRYFVTIILYCKTINPVIFFQQHTFFIVYILLCNSLLNWFSLTLQSLNIIDFFSDVERFFPGIAPLVSILNIDDLSLVIQKKKPTTNSRYTVNKIVIFIKIFFLIFKIFLTSSLYRSMWMIGRSQRVEEKNIDLSSV